MNDLPAILGGTPIRDRDYPSWPMWTEEERVALNNVLDSGEWWCAGGDQAEKFAVEFASYQNASFGLPMTNGTHTLEAALAACDIGEGDEVLVPGMTFVASSSAVLSAHAKPVFVDIDPATLCIDSKAAEAAITERTRAIVAVHVGGTAADLDALTDLATRHDLHLIEDCAHAHGTTWRGKGVGSYGSFGSFSHQQSKLMTAGEGGMLLTSDPDLYERAWSYWNCGRTPDGWFYHHPHHGSNMRMTEWQGAVLRVQLKRYPDQLAARNTAAVALDAALAQIPGLRGQHRDPRMERNGNYCYIFHYDAAEFGGMPLVKFEEALAAEQLPMGVSYPSIDQLEVYRTGAVGAGNRSLAAAVRAQADTLPVSAHAVASTVWMQHRMLLAPVEDVLDVARAAARIQAHASEIVSKAS